MTPPSIPPAPEPLVTPPKKGLPVIAWVGIGCGGIIVLVVILLIIFGVVFGTMFKNLAGEMEKNPAKASATLIATFDKNIEIVGADDEKQTVTIRDKSTGETTTLTAADFENGKYPSKKSDDTTSSGN